MDTVFSYIISHRLSQEYENIATEALSFILQNSESARNGIMKVIRSITPDMPDLKFRTQQTEKLNRRSIRPDMVGYHEHETRVFIENKFEAGLTDNQPLSYIEQLSKFSQPSVLLVVVPEIREETIWGELNKRLKIAEISLSEWNTNSSNIVHSIKTEPGPILALTSWSRLLSAIEIEVAADPIARNDLIQLRALCDAADRDAFIPISPSVITDQRTPAFILQLNSIIDASVDIAVNEESLNLQGVQATATKERIGRYVNISCGKENGFWIGIHFRLWKIYGRTPLWVVFSNTEWGRAWDVFSLIEPKADKENIFTKFVGNEFILAIDLPTGTEKDQVVRSIVNRLKWLVDNLNSLPQKSKPNDSDFK